MRWLVGLVIVTWQARFPKVRLLINQFYVINEKTFASLGLRGRVGCEVVSCQLSEIREGGKREAREDQSGGYVDRQIEWMGMGLLDRWFDGYGICMWNMHMDIDMNQQRLLTWSKNPESNIWIWMIYVEYIGATPNNRLDGSMTQSESEHRLLRMI